MELGDIFTTSIFTSFFVKAFSVVFSLIYFIYAIIILKQTKIMAKSISLKTGSIMIIISQLQVYISLGLMILSVFLI